MTYYDGLVPFANLMDQAGDWIPQRVGGGWGAGDSLTLRRDGWPARLDPGQFGTAVMAEVRYPAGTYAVSWAGRGSFDINGTTFASAPGGSGGAGRVTLDGQSLALLNLRATDPAESGSGRRVTVPGNCRHGCSLPPTFANSRPTARCVSWIGSGRTPPSPTRLAPSPVRTGPCRRPTRRGPRAGSALRGWSCWRTPSAWIRRSPSRTEANASNWVTCHAEVVASLLAPGLTPRYEFSNETWNPTFRAFHDLAAEGQQLGLGGGDAFLGLQLRVGQRHVAAMAAVTQGFAASGRKFLRVLAGQAANAWVLEQRLAAARGEGRHR